MSRRVLLMLTVVAVVGAALATTVGAKPKKPTGNLSLSAKPATVTFGGATTLSGRLTGANNTGRSIVLREDKFPFGDGFKPVAGVANAVTNAQGAYHFTLKPSLNTIYRSTVGGEQSANVPVNVRIRMSLRVSDSTPSVGQKVRFRGRACPAHNGLSVAIQRRSASGRYRTVKRTTLKAAPTCSTYSTAFRVRRDGRYRATADDADHARGFSRSRFLNAH